MDTSRADQPTRDAGKPKQKHVRIIYVPVAAVAGGIQPGALGGGIVATATLAQVAKHIGTPEATDIIVFNKAPWHFAGHGTDKQLRAHPQVHIDFPETVLVVQ